MDGRMNEWIRVEHPRVRRILMSSETQPFHHRDNLGCVEKVLTRIGKERERERVGFNLAFQVN